MNSSHSGNAQSAQQSAQALKRQQRGAAAQVLLALYEADQLANPAQWTWDMLDALPSWCLQDEQARNQLQMTCGALVLAPELRLLIDRDLIVAAHRLIGKNRFNHIVALADCTPIAINASAENRFESTAGEATLQDSVRTMLLQAGASVLKETLPDDALLALFSELLGDTAGEVPPKLASTLLIQAGNLLALREIEPVVEARA